MRILDINGVELNDSETLRASGHFLKETIQTVFHEAVAAIEEVGHYETVAVYPNGGKDIAWVVDTPASPASEPYWETEDILRYTPFEDEELADIRKTELITQLRSSDTAILEALEGLFGCESLSEFITALADIGSNFKKVLDERKSLRAQIAKLAPPDLTSNNIEVIETIEEDTVVEDNKIIEVPAVDSIISEVAAVVDGDNAAEPSGAVSAVETSKTADVSDI